MTKRIDIAARRAKSASAAIMCSAKTLAYEVLHDCRDHRDLLRDLECDLEIAQQACLPSVLKIHEFIMASDYAKARFELRTGLRPTRENVLAQLVEAISAPWLRGTGATVGGILRASDESYELEDIRAYLNRHNS
jgi:hypothetical protein